MLWFVICKGDLLLELSSDGRWGVPRGEVAPVRTSRRVQELPQLEGEECRGVCVDVPVAEEGRRMFPLRQTFGMLPGEHYRMAGKMAMLGYFDQNTRFCGVCGGAMRWDTAISKKCMECGKEVWPQVSPAVIVRIERGEEIMLVRSRSFRGDFYGLVAGFVETGETLEDCVRREVREETGVEIEDIRYFGSQPWPFPCGLMIGFTARYVRGEVRLQHSELSSGGWFRRDNLPNIPDRASIARWLIDEWGRRGEGRL
ncbi:MAG: NAD(+) diphosphatase [Bacteroidaceae bacterium]|nr:NAD(+) diphosphatase [Bacteroidaceae bacterium]